MHCLHLYTGDGKGKTTAAMGLALRALGHGQTVLIVQFMKDGQSGELAALRQLPGAVLFPASPMKGFTFTMTEDELRETARQQTENAARLTEEILRLKPGTVILDELATALGCGLVSEAAARGLLNAALASSETVVTGHRPPEWLVNAADYVSEIKAVRHPWADRALSGREGVEW